MGVQETALVEWRRDQADVHPGSEVEQMLEDGGPLVGFEVTEPGELDHNRGGGAVRSGEDLDRTIANVGE